MSAVRTACLVEDNLAGEPRVFPKGQYEAMVSFRVLHTDRVPDPDTGEWKDGRTSAVTVEFRGARAERGGVKSHHLLPPMVFANRLQGSGLMPFLNPHVGD